MTSTPTVLVTGSSRGLGRGIALELASRGFSVAIHYARNDEAARATAEECASRRVDEAQAFPVVGGDVGSSEDRARLVREVLSEFGVLDALVNNAGISVRERVDVLDASEASWDEVQNVNLKAPHFLTQLVAKHWVASRDRGRIASGFKLAFVGSISAEAMSTNRIEYCVSKAGLATLNRAWAARIAELGAQSLEFRAGIMKTDMTAGVQDKYDAILSDDAVVPQARWGTGEDMGRAVAAFLRGDLAFTTGSVIDVDGGFHLRRL